MARGAAMLSREGVIRACLAKYLYKNVFQNSIDFTQPEYRLAIFKRKLVRAEGFLRRLYRL